MTFSVQSEAGQLRQVIVHRPGLELSRLTPRNVGELLFDDVLWAKKAKEEHDAFAETLREKGVRVHYFGQLLGETLELPEGRAFVLDRLCTPEMLGPNLITPLRKLFDDLDGPALAGFLVGGVLKADLHPAGAHSLKWDIELLASALFRAGQATWVIAVELPASRAMMHLDTVMTMIDRDTFVQYPYLERQPRSWTLTPNGDDRTVSVTRNHDPVSYTHLTLPTICSV